MKIFLDTTQSNFVACLFDEKFKIKNKVIKATVYKVEEIPQFFTNILINYKLKVEDIKDFYINVGPGSFTGSRIALVYIRTIAQMTGANIFITNSFKLLSEPQDDLFIFANKNHSFKINTKNINDLSKVSLTEKSEHEQLINYTNLLNQFESNLSLFELTKPGDINPEYGSSPQIGSGK
jgi:tRNA A37 threonylcarbamoyladenosine modification protein TsaB